MSASAPRITTRVDADTQRLLAEAAALAGLPSVNAFVLGAAVEKAKDIMARERSLTLSERDAALLVEALDGPARVHPRLQAAARRYAQRREP